MRTRRRFLRDASVVAVGGGVLGRGLAAEALGLPVGLQLYSVREQMKTDVPGTLMQLGKIGYREVEAAGFYNLSAAQVKQDMTAAGLKCVSSHHPMGQLREKFDEILAYNKELGTEFLICSSPVMKNKAPAGTRGGQLSLDDWKWCAEQFNEMGGKVKAAGIKFGYHNHYHEFAPIDGEVPYHVLLKGTDPEKVSFELDCGWSTVAGVNPVEVLREFPHRIVMMHVKDFKLPEHPSIANAEEAKVTELGLGSIDYAPVFRQAAKTQTIKHVFVEQEGFDMPWVESLETDAKYMKKMR